MSRLSTLTRPQWLVLALAPLALLLWLGWYLADPQEVDPQDVTARPALWQAAKGEAQLWIFGTIHVVPKGEPWLSPAIAQAVHGSDRLYLEVTGLDAERKSRSVFERLGRSDGLAPITARLDEANAARYRQLQGTHGAALKDLDEYESWAAALLVNAAASSTLGLSAAQGGEAVLTRQFSAADKPIFGLETIDEQLGLFDHLPEAEQRQLLSQSLTESQDAPALFKTLHAAWARGDIKRLENEFLGSLFRSPVLRAALVDGRNDRWAQHLDAQLHGHAGTAMVAVGVGHLIGDGSLQARLQALGWRVERVQ